MSAGSDYTGGGNLSPALLTTTSVTPDRRDEGVALSRHDFLAGAASWNARPPAGAGGMGGAGSRPPGTSFHRAEALGPEPARITLTVNGRRHDVIADPRATLLDTLRERIGLTGTKKGCDRGECGACTVHVNGRRILACMTLAVMHTADEITTIEGIAPDGQLHPVQAAFIEHDAFQCGYCTSGQIMSALALLDEIRRGEPSAATDDVTAPAVMLSEPEIRERMSGNLCRCSCYPQIVAAVRQAGDAVAEPSGAG